MFTRKTLQEPYYDKNFSPLSYHKEYVREKLLAYGETETVMHDLFKAIYDDETFNYPYYCFTSWGTYLKCIKAEILLVIFQKRIMKRVVKKIMERQY